MSSNDDYEALKLENQLCFPLYACSRMVVKMYTPYLKPLGITYTHYIVLMVLWEKQSINVGDLGRTLFLDSGTLTPVLKRMETSGLVTRRRSDDDERSVIISLTEKGEKLKEKAKDIPSHIGQCLPLPHKKALELYEDLYAILNAVSPDRTCLMSDTDPGPLLQNS
jgi:Transcriptional regulators